MLCGCVCVHMNVLTHSYYKINTFEMTSKTILFTHTHLYSIQFSLDVKKQCPETLKNGYKLLRQFYQPTGTQTQAYHIRQDFYINHCYYRKFTVVCFLCL
jgi:hypothetical protein